MVAVRTWIFWLVLGWAISGCAPKGAFEYRYFWPPPPDEPKIEYLGIVMTDADLAKKGWFEDVVLGRTAPRGLFVQPFDVASDSQGRLFVSDSGQREVLVLDLVNGEKRSLKRDPRQDWLYFSSPLALACDSVGGVYVSDMRGGQIYYFGPDERVRFAFGKGELERVTGMAVDEQRHRLYAVDAPRSRVVVYSLDGRKQAEWGGRGDGPGEFNFPLDVDVLNDGRVFVLDSLNFRVQEFTGDGLFVRAFGELGRDLGGFQLPKGIALDRSGHVYVTDSRAHRLMIYDLEGQLLQVIGGQGRVTPEGISPGAMNLPSGVDADADDTIWVVDVLNRGVHRFQFLNEAYLQKHPIDESSIYRPTQRDQLPSRP